MLRQSQENQKLSQETINIINIKCHDLKYRLTQIPRTSDSDQREYIRDVSDALTIYENTYQTGNEALDLVLTEKSLICSQYQIKLSCMVDGTALAFLKSPDIYALFGNLMDNAIESVLKEPDEDKRIISLTTKEDKSFHGFGVRSIRYIVEKYKGDLLMRTSQERFLVDILFYSGQT